MTYFIHFHNNHAENWKISFAYFMYDKYKQMYFVLFYLLHSFWCCSYWIDGAGRAKKDSISEWMLIVVVNTFLLNLMINKSLKIDDRKMSIKWFSTVLAQTNCLNNSHTHSTHQIKVVIHTSLYLINTSTRLKESVYTTALVVVAAALVPSNIYIHTSSQ